MEEAHFGFISDRRNNFASVSIDSSAVLAHSVKQGLFFILNLHLEAKGKQQKRNSTSSSDQVYTQSERMPTKGRT